MKKLIALIVSLCMLVGMLPAVAETAAEKSRYEPSDRPAPERCQQRRHPG